MPYTDQFDRTDPFALNPIGIFDLWPRQAVWEARAMLAEGRSLDDLKQIAANVEVMICNEVRRLLRLSAGLSGSPGEGNPKAWVWPADLNPREPQELRVRHGDTNLYEAAVAPGQARLPTSIQFEDWEGYAVIALWKLVDFMDTLKAPRRRLVEAYNAKFQSEAFDPIVPFVRVPPAERHETIRLSAPMLVEAVRACTLAGESRLRAAHIAALKTRAQKDRAWAIERAEMKRRHAVSGKAREAAAVTHQHLPGHQEKAWALANSKPFSSRAAAARYAAARIAKSDGGSDPGSDDDCYTEKTVDQWLKERGWKRQPKPAKA
jgi:hypothetical protein